MLYGYMGKSLHVNLTKEKISEGEIPEKTYRQYIGATGLAAKYMYDTMDPRIDAFSPDNKLIFATGPFQATVIPFSGRYEVCAKSPLTGIWGGANSGGAFGPYMKRTGYDMIVIEGRAKKPVYLHVTDHGAEIRDAARFWGLDSYETDDAIKEDLDDPGVRIACIGQGGENLVRFAAVMNEQGRAAGRSGMGTVMGSKNLKAVAVYGEKDVQVAEPERLLNVVKGLMKFMKGNPIAPMFADYGTQVFLDTFIPVGDVPFKYWTDPGTIEKGAKIGGVRMKKEYLQKNIHCVTCPIGCGRYIKSEGKYAVEGHGPEYEAGGALGSLCMVEDIEALFKSNDMCNRYGLDVIEAGSMVAFAMMAYEKGLITMKDVGYPLEWGDGDAVIKMVDDMTFKRGFGKFLAEGIKPTVAHIGQGSDKFAIQVKGQHFAMHDPRNFSTLVLSYGTTERGACHTRGMGWLELAGGSYIADYGLSQRHNRHDLLKKPQATVSTQDLANNLNALTICAFSMMGMVLPNLQRELLNIVTGYNYTPEEFLKCGERMFNIKRVFSLGAAGISRKDDYIPEMVSIPGGTEGWVPDRNDLEKALDEYYRIRGWTLNGIPTRKKLKALDIELKEPYTKYITE